jgi:DNA-binding HxlR family transcriptional regulator
VKSSKITKRLYDDACGTAHALDLIGERWALLVMRELFWGPKRFLELRRSLPGISANVLTQRLEGLEAAGILVRKRLPPPVSAQVYELTDWGYEAEPLFQTLGRWAARSPAHDPSLPLSAASLMLSFRTMFDANRAGYLRTSARIEAGHEPFALVIRDRRIDIARGAPVAVDFAISGSARDIAGVVYGGQPLASVEVTGDPAAAARFVTLFPLPAKAAVPPIPTTPSPPSS